MFCLELLVETAVDTTVPSNVRVFPKSRTSHWSTGAPQLDHDGGP